MVFPRESSSSICFKGTNVVWYEKALNKLDFPWCWRNDWSPINLIDAHRRSLTRQISHTLNIVNLIQNFTCHIYCLSYCLFNVFNFSTTDRCFSEENNKRVTWPQRLSHLIGFWFCQKLFHLIKRSKISIPKVYWKYIRPCLSGTNIASQQEKL